MFIPFGLLSNFPSPRSLKLRGKKTFFDITSKKALSVISSKDKNPFLILFAFYNHVFYVLNQS
jgi:hypothetical protein